MHISVKLFTYANAVLLLGGCAALDRAMVPNSADTAINLKNDRVAVIVDACHYWSAALETYFSKEDALADIHLISSGVSEALDEKGIDHEVVPLPFFCAFRGAYTGQDIRQRSGGDVIGVIDDAPLPVVIGSQESSVQQRNNYIRLGCQYWDYKRQRLGSRAISKSDHANWYNCRKNGLLEGGQFKQQLIDAEKYNKLLILNVFRVSSTVLGSVLVLNSGPPKDSISATIFDLKKGQFVWDDFRNRRDKCWVSNGLNDYPVVEKVLAGLLCGIETSPDV